MKEKNMNKIVLRATALAMVMTFFIGLFAVPMNTQAAVLAANKSEILFDGEKIHGLKGFTYKVYKDRQDVRGIGMNERIDVAEGSIIYTDDQTTEVMGIGPGLGVGISNANLHVKGKILVHSNSELLDKHLDAGTSFQIILSVMQDSYPEGLGLKQFTFDGCHVDDREFQLDSHGYALTTYTFTSDRLREA